MKNVFRGIFGTIIGATAGAVLFAAASAQAMDYNGVKLQLGGFLASETVYRDHNMASDVATNFSNIPFPTAANFSTAEFRGSERQSRLSLLALGQYNDNTLLTGYFELDFLAAAHTANLNESSSFNPRTRHVYLNIDWLDTGWHLLAGQTWSLATLNGKGITPRNEVVPSTIDAQYASGFNWTRQWQTRIVKDWNKTFWAALSFENGQTDGTGGAVPAGTINSYNPIIGSNFTIAPSLNNMPDIIEKFAWESNYGHFEIYNLSRNFVDQYGTSAANKTQSTWTDAVGGGATVPLMNKRLELSLSGLFGKGIGRYGTSQLPDVTYASDGSFLPLTGSQYLAQLTWHANSAWLMYATYGQESVNSATGSGGAYGDNIGDNSGCWSLGGTCSAYTKAVKQVNLGFWWDAFKKEHFGTVKFGAQYSHTTRDTFADTNGIAPTAGENVVLTSLRYFPF